MDQNDQPVASGSTSPSGTNASNSKRSRKAESCIECRRLKLKCTRTWPCTNCKRRGVAELCPDGKLEYSTAEQSQKTARRLQNRIVELEAVIDILAGQEGASKSIDKQKLKMGLYPLPDVNGKTPQNADPDDIPVHGDSPADELPDTYTEVEGGALLSDHGATNFIGSSSAAFFVDAHLGRTSVQPSRPLSAFPFGAQSTNTASTLLSDLPSVDHARHLLQNYNNFVAWMYRILDPALIQRDIEVLYSGQSVREGAALLHPHQLAVVCMVFALGEIFDARIPNKQTFMRATGYFDKSGAFLTLPATNFLAKSTPFACEALHLMTTFLFNTGSSLDSQSAWPILGLCLRIGQAQGLHKDSSRWGLPPSEVAQRERIWYEAFSYDRLQCLNFGRPYLCANSLVEAKPPTFEARLDRNIANADAYHTIRYQLAMFAGDVADALCGSVPASYDEIKALDARVRAVEVTLPVFLQFRDDGTDGYIGLENLGPDERRHIIAQKHILALIIHKALLFLHRPWFAKALSSSAAEDPITSPFVSSFIACITSARKHSRAMGSILRLCPEISRWHFFALHAYASAAIQALVIIRRPKCMLTNEVWNDFAYTHALFKSEHLRGSPATERALPALESLRLQAEKALNLASDRTRSTMPTFPDTLSGANGLSSFAPFIGNDTPAASMRTADEDSYSVQPALDDWSASGQYDLAAFDQLFASTGGLNAAASFSLDTLPPSFAQPSEWHNVDPLTQTLLFWHPDGSSAQQVW